MLWAGVSFLKSRPLTICFSETPESHKGQSFWMMNLPCILLDNNQIILDFVEDCILLFLICKFYKSLLSFISSIIMIKAFILIENRSFLSYLQPELLHFHQGQPFCLFLVKFLQNSNHRIHFHCVLHIHSQELWQD